MSKGLWVACLTFGLVYVVLSSASAEPLVRGYVEDFTALEHCDTLNTTAWWDTVAGEVKLPSFELTLAGTYDTPYGAYGVAISGDHAYVIDHGGDLQVIDISDPTAPTLAGSYDTTDYFHGVAISADYAYVAVSFLGLSVIDISDPTVPTLAGNYDTPGYATGVAISGDYACVADQDSGLQVIDISDPRAPALVGSCNTPGEAWGIAISGDYAYVADGASGLSVIDISDPTTPVLAGSCDTPGGAHRVAISGDYAYLADWNSGLQVIDISDPTTPVLAGSYDTPDLAVGVAISGDYAYVGDNLSGLQVIDISDPTNPALASNYDTPDYAHGVAIAGDYAYVADWNSGLQVIRIAKPVLPPETAASCDTPDYAYGVAVSGDYAYVADRESGLQVVDISDPTASALAGSYDTPGEAWGVAISGDCAYVADRESGLQVIDISDPTIPAFAGSCDTPGEARGVAISGDYAYVGDKLSGLQVIDISDPTAPSLAGSCDTPGYAYGVAVSGDYAYVADLSSGLQVIDISDPTAPSLAGSYDTPGDALGVAVSGDCAYVADKFSGLQVIDISDPTAPSLAGSYDTPGEAYRVAISGDYAYVADRASGLQVIDISDPTAPSLAGSYDTPGEALDATISGDYAYIADGISGLLVIEVFQRRFDTDSNTAWSLSVDGTDETIIGARLSSTQTDSLRWEMSADSGGSWLEFLPGGAYQSFISPGSNLTWRSLHVYRPSHPKVNPTCTSLKIEWLYEFAVIDSIIDVPNDQGGWAYLYFTRSGYDFAEEDSIQVSEYFVYRRIDEEMLRRSVSAQEETTGDVSSGGQATIKKYVILPSWLWPSDIIYHDGDYCVVSGGTGPVGLPPGTWAVVGSVPAHQKDQNICLVPTVADSSGTLTYSVYCISAETTTPSVYFVSPPDSGYSLDNIAPSAPSGLMMACAAEVAWDECADDDFDYFTVYGSATPGLDSTAALIGYTIETMMDVSGDRYDYYHVTATDFAGNEGDASSVENTYAGVSVLEDLPQVFALRPNRPNPFRSGTVIGFDLPEPCAVRLELVDVQGRTVGVLTDEAWPAGRHSVVWSGENDGGEVVGPGVYFVRIEACGFTAINKILRMK